MYLNKKNLKIILIKNNKLMKKYLSKIKYKLLKNTLINHPINLIMIIIY